MSDQPAAPRVAIVTGGLRGIGAAIVDRLGRSGALVVVGDSTAGDTPGGARDLWALHLDVSDPMSCTRFVDRVVAELGRVDMLVNNAAINHRRTAQQTTVADWERVMRTNLTGTFAMCGAAFPALSRSQGCVVNLGSVGGHNAVSGSAAYGVSKAAIMHLTKVLALEWAVYGIRVNAVAPGLVATAMSADVMADPAYLADKMRGLPLGRSGAGVIVTHNLKDFPRERLPDNIDVQSPAVFAHHAVSLNPDAALRGIEAIAARTGRRGPTRDVAWILSTLEQRYGLTDAVDILRAGSADGSAS